MPWRRSCIRSAGQPRRKFSLDEVRILLRALGDPQLQLSLGADCGDQRKRLDGGYAGVDPDSSGMRTGLYTSPHLERPTSASG